MLSFFTLAAPSVLKRSMMYYYLLVANVIRGFDGIYIGLHQ